MPATWATATYKTNKAGCKEANVIELFTAAQEAQ
jgi:hypothetical protein